ncbi:YbaN family protein [Vibrio vulnificus]|uniref:YbaN family protein n=1 Tax=Vibrio vulnificus TaxID=672 RepID=UPI00093396FA|nr:YbaN family protein [Vibrio vulnificus]
MRIRRLFLNIVGGLSLCLGIAGIVLPLLPTTPFILLASACFLRSSPRFHHWLHNHKTFGSVLNNWQQNRAVTRRVKQRAILFILLSFSVSIWIAPLMWLKIALMFGLIVLLGIFVRLPVSDSVAARRETD